SAVPRSSGASWRWSSFCWRVLASDVRARVRASCLSLARADGAGSAWPCLAPRSLTPLPPDPQLLQPVSSIIRSTEGDVYGQDACGYLLSVARWRGDRKSVVEARWVAHR